MQRYRHRDRHTDRPHGQGHRHMAKDTDMLTWTHTWTGPYMHGQGHSHTP